MSQKHPPAPSRKPALDFTGRRKSGLCAREEDENWRENLSFKKRKAISRSPKENLLWILPVISESACVPVEQTDQVYLGIREIIFIDSFRGEKTFFEVRKKYPILHSWEERERGILWHQRIPLSQNILKKERIL